MKRFGFALLSLTVWLSIWAATDCSTTSSLDRTAYLTVASTTLAVEQARQAYIGHINTCQCVTSNQFDKVQGVYVDYQMALQTVGNVIAAYNASTTKDPNQLKIATTLLQVHGSNVVNEIMQDLPGNKALELQLQLSKVK